MCKLYDDMNFYSWKPRDMIKRFSHWNFLLVIGIHISECLNLNRYLEVFGDCTVHIVLHEVNSNYSLGYNHVLTPTKIPIILTQQIFNDSISLAAFKCVNDKDSFNFGIESLGEFKFPARPPPKRLCTVQIYVNPRPCLIWSAVPYSETPKDTRYELAAGNKCLNPRSHTSTIFHNQVLQNEVTCEQYTCNLFSENGSGRHGWYLINVKSRHRNSYNHVPSYTFSDIFGPLLTLHYVCLSIFWPTLPVLFVWEVNSSGYTHSNFVVDTAAVIKTLTVFNNPECEDVVTYKAKFSSEREITNCFAKYDAPYLASLYEFSHEITNSTNFPKLFGGSNLFLRYSSVEENANYLTLHVPLPENLVEVEWLNAMFPNFTHITTFSFYSNQYLGPTVKFNHQSSMWQNILWSNDNPVHFISCTAARKTSGISFLGYANAFDIYSWIALVIVCIITGGIVTLVTMRASYGIFIHATIEMLLGQTVSDATIKRYKWILAPWLFTGIVYSYGFQGDNIKQFTTPQHTDPIDTFKEIAEANYTIYSNPADWVIEDLRACLHYAVFQNMQDPNRTCLQESLSNFESKFHRTMVFAAFDETRNFTTTEKILFGLLKTPETVETFGQLFRNSIKFNAKRIEECSMVAYADDLFSVLQIEKEVLKNDRLAFDAELHVSTKPYRSLYMMLMPHRFPILPEIYNRRQYSLFQSGIWSVWWGWKKQRARRFNNALNEKRSYAKRQPKPIGISYNIRTIFYVSFSLLIPSAFILCGEIGIDIEVFKMLAFFVNRIPSYLAGISEIFAAWIRNFVIKIFIRITILIPREYPWWPMTLCWTKFKQKANIKRNFLLPILTKTHAKLMNTINNGTYLNVQ